MNKHMEKVDKMFIRKNNNQKAVLCKRVVDEGIILALIEGELTPEQENFWLEHIRNCKECMALAADVVWADAGIKSLAATQQGRDELSIALSPQFSIPVEQLRIDQEITEDLLNEGGELLLAKGTKITPAIIDILLRRGVKQVRFKQEEKPKEPEVEKKIDEAKEIEKPVKTQETSRPSLIEPLEPPSETAFISQDFREGFFFAGEVSKQPKFISSDYAKLLGKIAHREVIKEATKRRALTALVNSFDLLHNNMPVNLEEVKESARDVVTEILKDDAKTLSILDMYLVSSKIYTHSFNTLVIFTSLLKNLNFDKSDILNAGEAALMHDIGRVIPRREDEHEDIYKNHPVRGYRFLMKQGTYSETMLTIVLNHHERYDGLGFPRKIKGDKLGLLDQVLIVANRYDQAITDPIHDVKRDFHRAAQLIYQSPGVLVAPEVVNAFLNVMGIYPPGTYVKLKSGEEGIVREANYMRPFQPKITLIRTSGGRDLSEPIEIDLRELENNSIERCLDITTLLNKESGT